MNLSFIASMPYLCFIYFLYLNLHVLGDAKLGIFHVDQTLEIRVRLVW